MTEHMSAHLGLLPLDERVKKMAEIDRKAAEYEQQQRDAAELRRVENQRQELERHLTERGRRYVENTGAVPSEVTVAGWRDEWAAEKEAEHEAERQKRYDAAADDGIF